MMDLIRCEENEKITSIFSTVPTLLRIGLDDLIFYFFEAEDER